MFTKAGHVNAFRVERIGEHPFTFSQGPKGTRTDRRVSVTWNLAQLLGDFVWRSSP